MRQIILLFILALTGTTLLSAQQPLPRDMTADEELQMPGYLAEAIKPQLRTPSIPANPRTMAEWEELQGIAISWVNAFWEIQAEIVRHAREETTVYINTTNETEVMSRLDQAGVDYSSNVEFINAEYNSIWIRDYGPNTVYIHDVDSLIFVDWIYNRPRFLDDQIPQAIGNFLGIPVIQTANQPNDLVHTGGNFMSNGNGQGFSSNLVLDENGPNNNWGMSNHSEAEVNNIMENFMGITEYVKMTNLPFDAIHHIDMHMKLIDEETIILGEYPDGIADGPQIEANLQYVIDNFITTFKRPFNIIRIPMPPDNRGRYPHQNGDYRTYANAMMINKSVLIPTYEEQYDTIALQVWQAALPGHNIIGIDCNDIIPLSGALHCIIKEIGINDPIWINHKPIVDPLAGVEDDFELSAEIKHNDTIVEAWLHYSITDAIEHDSILMTNEGNDVWTASLPHNHIAEYTYYIKAIAQTGKSIEKPQTGSQGGGWKFTSLIVGANATPANQLTIGDAFPNPASAITAIPISITKSEPLRVALYDVSGRLMDVLFDEMYHTYQSHLFFNASNYSTGLYVIKIESESGFVSQKITIE